MATLKMEDMIDRFNSLTEKPVKYLTVQKELKEDIKDLVKTLYDYTKSQESSGKSKTSALPELIVKDFDEEQIWQQIEMQNAERWDQQVWDVANYMSVTGELAFPVDIIEAVEQEPTQSEHIEQECNGPSCKSSAKVGKKQKSKRKLEPKSKPKTSVVDDKFFSLQDMEKFLLNEEKSEVNLDKKKKDDSDEESIDLFDDVDDDDDDESGEEGERKDMMYYDFFEGEQGDKDGPDTAKEGSENESEQETEEENEEENEESEENENEEETVEEVKVSNDDNENKKKEKRVTFATNEPEESDYGAKENVTVDDNNTPNYNMNDKEKSEFELRQERLRDQISRLEKKTLTKAPWQLQGEITSKMRPENSLLEEVVDFDLTTRPAPIITEQTTLSLEDIIRQRVKDKAWDDVIRKEKPVDDQLAFRKPEILDQSKSKLSLAQVYEAEYLKQKQALTGGDEEEKEPESHTEIREAMSKLFSKLDALTHYHYTPKPPQAEVKIISNTPAISMEEVAPVATSEAALLAPEEVKKKQRGDLMSKEERTQTDKNRERRKKKKLQRKKGKVMKVTEHRNTTKGTETTDKALKTSKAFFQQLNDDTTSLIKSKKRSVKNKGQ